MQSITTKLVRSANAVLENVSQIDTVDSPRTEAWRWWVRNLILVFSDVVFALVIWEMAFLIRKILMPGELSGVAAVSILPVVLVWVGVRALQGLYPGYGMNEVEELRRQTYASLATLAIAATFALAFQIGDAVSRLLVGLVFLGLLLFSPFMRQFTKKWLAKNGVWGNPVIILGSKETGVQVEKLLSNEWTLGYRPVAVVESRLLDERLGEVKEGGENRTDEGVLVEVLVETVELGCQHKIDTLVLAMPYVPREHLAGLANLASMSFRRVIVMPDLIGISTSAAVARDLAGNFGLEIRHSLLSPVIRRAKRVLDVSTVVIGGLLIAPLILLLCLLVRLESRGPVFYAAERMGRDGKMFSCIKFRTMVPDAEDLLQRLLEEDPAAREEYTRYHKLRKDPRVTRVGRLLRKTSLDELPQLWNVLRGEMSLVGPRPYLPRESDSIGATQSDILRVDPGMTGLWQIGGRSSASFDERVWTDVHYVRNWSIWLDLMILARTVRCVLFTRGAC